MNLTENEIRIRKLLRDDFEHYASKCLRIRTKSGQIEHLILNEAQRYIHKRIEEQRAKTGKVRAIILKGRQQGCSTYVEGRFYWRVTHSKGVRAFILTHEEEATANLFELAKRYHDNCPQVVKPNTGASSAKELNFDKLDSGYKVGTAGNKSVGRSSTVQLFHGSEVGFWPNAQQHAAGILQAIPDELGTEVILESTANGLGNFFHQQWQQAEAGQSEYIAIFVPWYWQKEYRKEASTDFVATEEESELKNLYGLDNDQLVWRRNKIVELNDPMLFKQEYPFTSSEAFQVSGLDPLIKPEFIMRARKCKVQDVIGCKALGVDPARFGDDRTSMTLRQGRKVHWQKSHSKLDTMQVAGLVLQVINNEALRSENGDRVFIDVGGLGAGVYDRLRELVSDRKLLVQVNFGGSPLNATKYKRKDSEMWGEMREWFYNEPCEIPDSDELHSDLTMRRYSYDSNSALEIEKKDAMKKRGLRSPDCGDSLALTFAQPLIPKKDSAPVRNYPVSNGWMG